MGKLIWMNRMRVLRRLLRKYREQKETCLRISVYSWNIFTRRNQNRRDPKNSVIKLKPDVIKSKPPAKDERKDKHKNVQKFYKPIRKRNRPHPHRNLKEFILTE